MESTPAHHRTTEIHEGLVDVVALVETRPQSAELMKQRQRLLHNITEDAKPAAVRLFVCPICAERFTHCDNPTAIYFGGGFERELQWHRKRGDAQGAAKPRRQAEEAKPLYKLWILTEDTAVRKWARGSRHMIQAKVVSAELRGTIYGYVEARLVLRMEPKPAATAPAQRIAN